MGALTLYCWQALKLATLPVSEATFAPEYSQIKMTTDFLLAILAISTCTLNAVVKGMPDYCICR